MSEAPPVPRNLLLIGMRGAGKTTVGRLLANELQWEFLDTDAVIEQREQATIREIFATRGEAAFRAIEAQIVDETCANSGQVISLGGGAVLDTANREYIRRAGVCVWLSAKPETLIQRMANDDQRQARPSLTSRDWADEVRELAASRAPIYAELATIRVDTDGRAPADVARAVLSQTGLRSTE
ncbi:MAG: shikimate kinase [Phycisphaerales bacterium]|nr:shikimate kinase [Phycisphaerales bacterium]